MAWSEHNQLIEGERSEMKCGEIGPDSPDSDRFGDPQDQEKDNGIRDRAVTDYISGMSDEFAIRTFEDVFVPRKWHVL